MAWNQNLTPYGPFLYLGFRMRIFIIIFMQIFSKKYSSISELDPDWLRLKFSAADWLVKQIKDIDPNQLYHGSQALLFLKIISKLILI